MTTYRFVQVNEFTPTLATYRGSSNPTNNTWRSFGSVKSVQQTGNDYQLTNDGGVSLVLSILSDRAIRVRFSPDPAADFTTDESLAVVERNLGTVTVSVAQNDATQLVLDTGYMTVTVERSPYRLSVTRNRDNQLIHQDAAGKNLVYIPGQSVTAYIKESPADVGYVGFGEKAGAQVAKNGFYMTFFNFDNYTYATGPVPDGQGGPLDPREPLYNSMPLMLALRRPQSANPTSPANAAGSYAYGLFLDNVSQSYFNVGAGFQYTDEQGHRQTALVDGQYYFGALYGELDSYILADDGLAGVIAQYKTLTGKSPMPPRYALGFHQGAYGYFDRAKLTSAAKSYRAARIPIDGLHIDVDFQDNYRTFTNSPIKFPDPKMMFAELKAMGFKCSTNITGMITANPYDGEGKVTPYPTREDGRKQGMFLFDTRDQGVSPDLFIAREDYGQNFGSNPYNYPLPPDGYLQQEAIKPKPAAVPPLTAEEVVGPTLDALENPGFVGLGTSGYYADMGRPEVQAWWGQQYQFLLDAGLEMVWQDMTCPAMAENFDNDDGTFVKTLPLDLHMFHFGKYRPNAEVHNAFALYLVRATFEGLLKLRPQKRPFIIARGGYAGVHRYAALWTGDSSSSWDSLRINVPEVLNLGLSAVPISGCDIGGFAPGTGCVPFDNGTPGNQTPPDIRGGEIQGGVVDYELFTRWVTMGSFLPWFRIHYDGYLKAFQEPYNYGEPVPTNCRRFIEIRYRLLQVFYDAMYRNTQDGTPICRPLFLSFPHDAGVWTTYPGASGDTRSFADTEFMVGDSILVAPILQPRSQPLPGKLDGWYRDIYLPLDADGQTEWYAFQNNEKPLQAPVRGGTVVNDYHAPLDVGNLSLLPIYVRAGAILPTRDLEQYVGEKAVNPITLNIYPGQDSTYELYQDDGASQDYASGKYRVTTISHTGITGGQKVDVVRTKDGFTPTETFFYVAFLGTALPKSVTVGGSPVPNIVRSTPDEAAAALANATANAYYHNDTIDTLFVKVFDNGASLEVIANW